jgi:hypothetical protein
MTRANIQEFDVSIFKMTSILTQRVFANVQNRVPTKERSLLMAKPNAEASRL